MFLSLFFEFIYITVNYDYILFQWIAREACRGRISIARICFDDHKYPHSIEKRANHTLGADFAFPQ